MIASRRAALRPDSGPRVVAGALPLLPGGDGERPFVRERRLDALLVTTPDGVLVGLLRRADAEDAERACAAAGGGQP